VSKATLNGSFDRPVLAGLPLMHNPAHSIERAEDACTFDKRSIKTSPPSFVELFAWMTVTKVAVFYMRRPLAEDPYLQHGIIPVPFVFAVVAKFMIIVLLMVPFYVCYKLGFVYGIFLMVLTWTLQTCSITMESLFFRFKSMQAALFCAPISVVGFVMSISCSLQI
jgi:hypothetical protein